MIAWNRLARRLAKLAQRSPAEALLTVNVPLARRVALAAPPGTPWFHWQRPDAGLVLTGIGEALKVESDGGGRFAALGAAWSGLTRAWRSDAAEAPPPLAFAGFAFAREGGAPLPNASLTVPALWLRQQPGRAWASFTCPASGAADAIERWRELWHGMVARNSAPAPQFARKPTPLEDRAFFARGHAALAAIERGDLDKLVLTRRARLEAESAIDAWAVLDALAAANPACAVWGVGCGEQAFLGASPELLLGLRGDTLAADALAGTVWSGDPDDGAPCPPLEGDKNRREHEFVTAALAEALGPLCENLVIPATPETITVQNIRHLRRRLHGRRPASVGVFDLLGRLHPTPAVGGTPTADAGDWLATHGDRRGAWYTGGIGWLDTAGAADFAVALRCGLISGRDITLYAGAGFVRGSDPQLEFAETEAKLAPMLAALRAAPALRTARQAASR